MSSPWVTELLEKLGMPTDGGMPAGDVARAYVSRVEGLETGIVIRPA